MTLYNQQFSRHELTESALVALDNARHKALHYCKQYGSGGSIEEFLEAALKRELDALLKGLQDPAWWSTVHVAAPLLPLLQFWSVQRLYVAIEALSGFIRAHAVLPAYIHELKAHHQAQEEKRGTGDDAPADRHPPHHRSCGILKESVYQMVRASCTLVVNAAHVKLAQLTAAFPRASRVIKLLLSATHIAQIKMVRVEDLHCRGVIQEAEYDALLQALSRALHTLHYAKTSFAMASLLHWDVSLREVLAAAPRMYDSWRGGRRGAGRPGLFRTNSTGHLDVTGDGRGGGGNSGGGGGGGRGGNGGGEAGVGEGAGERDSPTPHHVRTKSDPGAPGSTLHLVDPGSIELAFTGEDQDE